MTLFRERTDRIFDRRRRFIQRKTGLAITVGAVALCLCAPLVKGQKPKPAHSALAVANLLDRLVQPRFLLDAGKFGAERLVIAGHEDSDGRMTESVYRLRALTKKEKILLRGANAAKRDYALGFIHCPHKTGRFLPKSKTNEGGVGKSIADGPGFQSLVVHEDDQNLYDMPDGFETENWNKQNLARVNKVVAKAMPRLKRGHSVETRTGGLLIVMRPVKASKAACLNCHRGAKPGDALGIMAYAVSETRNRQ